MVPSIWGKTKPCHSICAYDLWCYVLAQTDLIPLISWKIITRFIYFYRTNGVIIVPTASTIVLSLAMYIVTIHNWISPFKLNLNIGWAFVISFCLLCIIWCHQFACQHSRNNSFDPYFYLTWSECLPESNFVYLLRTLQSAHKYIYYVISFWNKMNNDLLMVHSNISCIKYT